MSTRVLHLIALVSFESIFQLKAIGQVAPDPVDLLVSGPSLPPIGRSLFDHLIADEAGGVVPYPFDALVQLFGSEQGRNYEGALLPRGRSLQRNANQSDIFLFPRVVLAALQLPNVSRKQLAKYDFSGKVFLGFSEPAKQVEVISFNERAGRFEFQVVKDYGPGLKPTLVYANRSVCVACHQSGAAIFPQKPWPETQANPLIAQELKAKTGKEKILGIDLGFFTRTNVSKFDGLSFFSRATLLSYASWNYGCDYGRDELQSLRCRRSLLRSTARTRDPNFPEYSPLTRLSTDLGRPFSLPSTTIPSPDIPLQGSSSSEIRDILLEAKMVGSLNPALKRPDVPLDRMAFESSLSPFSFNDATQLLLSLGRSDTDSTPSNSFYGAVLDKLLEDAIAGDQLARKALGKPFNRKIFLSEVSKRAGLAKLPGAICCDIEDESRLPKPIQEGTSVPPEQPKDLRLSPFLTYCSQCHSSPGVPGVPDFFSEGEAVARSRLAAQKDLVALLLNWENQGVRIMPPPTSKEFASLTKPENSSDKIAMLTFLQAFADE